MDCPQALNELSALIDGELPAAECAALEAHLAGCTGCRAAWNQLRVDDAALLRAFMPRRRAAAALADRVIDQLVAEQQRRGLPRAWALPLIGAAAGFLLAVLIIRPPLRLLEQPTPAQAVPLARLAVAIGRTEVRNPPENAWFVCPPSGVIQTGAAVRTADDSRCELEASDGTQIRLDADTVIELPSAQYIRLTQGQLYSSLPANGKQLKIETPEAVVEAEQGKFDFSCSSGEASLTVVEGTANVACKSGTRRVTAGERVRLVSGRVEETAAVADPLQATAWINELLVLKGPDNPELAERLNDILAQVGRAKLSYLYEDEIRRLGSRAALPLLRYLESPRSQADPASRVAAARIAADLADSSAVADLITLLADGDAQVRFHIARALQRLTGADQGQSPEAWRDDPLACEPALEAWHAWRQQRSAELGRQPQDGDSRLPPSPESK